MFVSHLSLLLLFIIIMRGRFTRRDDHRQHHGKHACLDPLMLSPLSLYISRLLDLGAGEPCLRADQAADLARALFVSAGTGEESR